MIKKFFWFLFFCVFMACLFGGGVYYWSVVLHPGDEIKPENINNILGKESPVFYNDGTTRLGVFFDQAHRQYVPYDMIPVNFINALVASEDNRFFSHFGFDVVGIVRASIKNIEARRVVQGGSTLTQQTAKNLFKRTNRSIQAKLKELLYALRLEHHYTKEKIFEFYANQFYVSGNGHGLGVAARYYFDKKPEELSLLECAYIAGSVKRPNYYNPFIKKDQKSAEKALEKGRERVNYVLTKMLSLGMISEYQHGLAKFSEIGFKKGKVGYSLDYVMEMVKDAVTSTEVVDALAKHNITNIATSGVRIITTVDKELQQEAMYALRHDLSRLDVRLRGYEGEEVQEELKSIDYKGDNVLREKALLLGIIKSITIEGESPEVDVYLGRRNGSGIIDKNGLTRLVTARLRWQKNPYSKVKSKDYKDFLQQLQVGDRVWVTVRHVDKKGQTLLDIEKFPKVNGGALVVKDGVIKAMAGGVENRFYNRAIYAKRTMGSSFKPFVFAAALQLGWNSTDHLRNTRDVFVFQKQFYFPRPDHSSPFEEVSMSWAGVHSENVASVWLLSHLCDKLKFEQFQEVARKVDMAPRTVEGEEEPYSLFRARIRDKFGIIVDSEAIRQAAFNLAVKNIETDLVFEGRDIEYSQLQNMHYGLGFEKFREDIKAQLKDKTKKLKKRERAELQLRRKILETSFLSLESVRNELKAYAGEAVRIDGSLQSPYYQSGNVPQFRSRGPMEAELFFDNEEKRYCFVSNSRRTASLLPIDPSKLRNFLLSKDQFSQQQFWKDVYLDNRVTVGSFDLLNDQINREQKILKEKLPYSMEVLTNIDDFRIFAGLRYLIALGREFGISSKLEPVLSFPLGSNVVTLLETLRMYEGLISGNAVVTGESKDENMDLLCIIDRIESDDGEILYQPERQRKQLLAPETSLVIGHILENIVKHGTGRYADRNIKLKSEDHDNRQLDKLGLSIPVLGKTGTANRYTNASFFGYLPGLSPSKDSLVMENGYAVGVYVGFDDNKEMRKGATKITGSAGALPTWTHIVNSIIEQDGYSSNLDPVDLSFYGLTLKREEMDQKNVAVAPDNGGLVPMFSRNVSNNERYQPSIITFGKLSADGHFTPDRQFYPFWKNQQSPTTSSH